MQTPYVAVLLTLFVLTFGTASCSSAQNPELKTNVVDHANAGVQQAARRVVDAFNVKDGERLAELVHPEKGVRFSPYAYVDVEGDVVLSRAHVRHFWTDRRIYTWGYADGTGDPISLTPADYSDRHIMDRDFLNPSSITINSAHARGNTIDNAASVYPNGIRVEYYVKPPPGKGMPEFEWAALRLVFERIRYDWFLVAVIHDEWTT